MLELSKRLRYAWSFLRRDLVHLNLQILYQCNFRCTICDFWKQPYSDMPLLPAKDVKIIADKLRRIGPLIITVGGGEPLLHTELTDIVRSLAAHHFPVMICNGSLMTSERARELWSAGLYEISISLDYADSAKHDRQRGYSGAFDRACAGLEMLARNRVHPHQRVHMISVVMDDNLDDIEPLIRLASKMGITYLVTLYSHGRGTKLIRSPERDVSDYLLGLRKKYPNFVGVRGYLSRFTESICEKKGVNPCYAGKNLFNIDCQGNVTRCIDRLDHVAGNILSDDISSIRKELLRQFESNDCGDCWTSCRGNIESLMYGPRRIRNLIDSYYVTKPVPLVGNGQNGRSVL
jgi:MoaA/NifB/PqqE/SkfB family radical SAM enzyme